MVTMWRCRVILRSDVLVQHWLVTNGHTQGHSWFRGTVVERRSVTGELHLSCARPAADG